MMRLLAIGLVLIMACKEEVKQVPKHTEWPASFGFGRTATEAEIVKLDIDVRPDGKGLPAGQGTALEGKPIYMAKCAACHGKGNEPDSAKLLGPLLVSAGDKIKTVGNYWPYATTLFDYIRRAMPYNEPGSLTNDEVYKLTAYVLFVNKIVKEKEVIDAESLPNIEMPARDRFVDDDRRGGHEIK